MLQRIYRLDEVVEGEAPICIYPADRCHGGRRHWMATRAAGQLLSRVRYCKAECDSRLWQAGACAQLGKLREE